jgi:Fe-S cluster assembly protein SufD
MTTIATATARTSFATEDFLTFLRSRDEPAWLQEWRERAFKHFENAPWPSSRDEEWMRTDIRLFKLNQFRMAEQAPQASLGSVGLLRESVDLAGHTVAVGSHLVEESVDEELTRKGVLFGSLDRFVRERSELLEALFARGIVNPAYDKFAALNAAFWHGGTLLYVPKNVRIERPLHSFTGLEQGGVDAGKLLIVLDQGAEATFLTETVSTGDDVAGLHCGSIEIAVGPGAKLRYVNLQNWGTGVWHFAHQKAVVDRGGQLQWTIGALGARLAKVNQHVALIGSDAEAQVNGVMFTQGRQHLSYNTHQHHEAPYCRSDLLYKAALQDTSRTVWRGMIKVDRDAQRTDAYQRNDNLMLSADARADSIPGLEIEADDVRCTHGSTSGRVDDGQVFYAMSRGYTRKEAVRMIVSGFFQQVFDRITIPSVRDALSESISQRVQDIA